MLQTLRNAWKIEELRKKILFTLVIVLLYRLGNAVPVPYVNTTALQYYFAQLQNTVLGLYNVMSGGAFSTATIFALSIQPYINASIIIQLLTIAIPALERMAKEEGEEGRKKIASITRYATVGIGLLMGFAYYMLMKNNGLLDPEAQNSVFAAIVVILTFTSGSALIMWLGEQITEFGIGNGISIILFSSIVSRLPRSIIQTISNVINGSLKWWAAVLVFLGALLLIILIVFVNDAERRLPVQYAKRVVGRKMYGGQSTYLPMKVNMSGVMPIIFAQSIAMLPATIAALAGSKSDGWFMKLFDSTSITYALIYFLQPGRGREQPEEERRLHPGLPSRQAHQRVYSEGSEQDHAVRRDLSGHRCLHTDSDLAFLECGSADRSEPRRNVDHHRGRCGTGNGACTRGTDDDAQLQGLPVLRRKPA